MKTIYNKKANKKFTKSFDLCKYQILTDDGYVDLVSLHETIPYEIWNLKLSNGYVLECADDHIVFDCEMNEIFVKNLSIGDRVKTDDGYGIVIELSNTNTSENMYDFEMVANSNSRYYTNGILSHNTELAKQLAKYLFDSEDSLIRLDMSEYVEKISINRIIGAPAAFVGYDDHTILDTIRKNPYSIILLDEIEKAHPDVFNLFLQIMDDGHLTDTHGRKVSFKNCIILMTSNVGTRQLKDFGTGVGFATKNKETTKIEEIKSILEKELKKTFAPEFINRLDEIIYFRDLGKDDIIKIVTIELQKSIERAKVIEFDIVVDELLINHIVEVGYDPQYGARPLKRTIQRLIDDTITNYIISNNPKKRSTLYMSYNDNTDTKISISDTYLTTNEQIKKKSRKK